MGLSLPGCGGILKNVIQGVPEWRRIWKKLRFVKKASVVADEQMVNWETKLKFNINYNTLPITQEEYLHLRRQSGFLVSSQESVVNNIFLGSILRKSEAIVDHTQGKCGFKLVSKEE